MHISTIRFQAQMARP